MLAVTLHLTGHAIGRARQRCGRIPIPELAIRLPKATARRRSYRGDRGTRIFLTATSVLIVRGRRVVTCHRLTVDVLADVLVRLMFVEPTGAQPDRVRS